MRAAGNGRAFSHKIRSELARGMPDRMLTIQRMVEGPSFLLRHPGRDPGPTFLPLPTSPSHFPPRSKPRS